MSYEGKKYSACLICNEKSEGKKKAAQKCSFQY
jgi:hypothetical protein